jgi:hypothetical protein
MRNALRVFVSSLSILGFYSIACAQQDVAADPAHHKLEFENNCVRVVRATFGPGEKAAALFDAKDVVIVSLTGSQGGKLTFPDGKSITTPANTPGQVYWAPAGRIQPENTGNMRIEYIVIEPKGCS